MSITHSRGNKEREGEREGERGERREERERREREERERREERETLHVHVTRKCGFLLLLMLLLL